MERKPTSQEIADSLAKKVFSEIDEIINECSSIVKDLSPTYLSKCPRNPLELSDCSERANKIRDLLETTKQARDYINSASVEYEQIMPSARTVVKNSVIDGIDKRLSLIKSFEDIGRTYQSMCPLSEGKKCTRYTPKLEIEKY